MAQSLPSSQTASSVPQRDLLLKTKLYIPPVRPNLVPRPRLTERLEQGLARPLTLLSAPAGFGKTTLIGEWRATPLGRDFLLAWLSLDGDDNDPARFLTHLIAAMEMVQPGVGAGALALLQSPQSILTRAILTTLINGLATFKTDFALVLDDYHLIEAQPIHDALAFLLDHLPSHMHLLIATRTDPPLPLARLRVRNQLMELRAADLRFTPGEAAAFLNEVMGLGLSGEDVAALEARTEGWIAGLQLAAISMQGRNDISGFIAAFTGSNRYILDYLVEEVLRREPESVRAFLMHTSILERLCAPLCDAVTGRTDSQAMLTMLEQTNLFTIPLDEERRWYRYHNLFAEFLHSYLQAALLLSSSSAAEGTHELHRRAADWYEQNGFATEAIRHALDAQDLERAARLIEQAARETLMRGETSTLQSWLKPLPADVIRSRPRLCLAHAWALVIAGQLDDAEPYLQEAVQVASAADVEIHGEAAAIRSLISVLQGDAPRATELSRQALEHLPADDLFLRGLVALNLGMAHDMQGNMVAASQAYTQARAIGQAAHNAFVSMMAVSQLADLKALQGKLHEAADAYREAIRLATEPGKQLPIAAMVHASMGHLLYEWNDLDAATRHLTAAMELGQQWESTDIPTTSLVHLAHIRQAQGDVDGARDLIRQTEQAFQGHIISPPTVSTAKAYQARLWVRQGNLDAADRWAREYQARPSDVPGYPGYLRQIEGATWARVLIAQGKPEPAIGLLGSLLQVAEAAGQIGNVIELLTLQALALEAQGESVQATTTLHRALTLAEPEGYIRTFVDEGEPMRRLIADCRSWIEKQSHSEAQKLIAYAGRLLTAFPQAESAPLPAIIHQPSKLVEPLSERELEVLRLIADGFSNAEIGAKLFIAVGTVKRHINNIYGKLDVQSRTQAVARARELGLL